MKIDFRTLKPHNKNLKGVKTMGAFDVSTGYNTLTVTLEGKFTQEDHPKFVAAFKAGVNKIQPANSDLIFNAGEFQVLATDMHEKLRECFILYKSYGFKKILMNIGDNIFVAMQVKRIAKDVGLDNFDII
jgi:hypothetical protein